MDNDRDLDRDRVYEFGLWIATLLWLVAAVMVAFNFGKLPPVLPWFYSLPWGEGILIKKIWLWGVLGGAGGILGLNMALAVTVAKEESLAKRFLVWGAGAVELLIVLGLIKVILIIL